jgi:hypothetical protein
MGEGDETNLATLRGKAERVCSIPVLRRDEVGLLRLIANCAVNGAQSSL